MPAAGDIPVLLSSLLGTDGSPILQYLVVFAIMVVLLSLFALAAKRFARGRGALMGGAPRGRQPRLGIVDIYELDRQRQLILLRRDNVEHLLMVGGPNDLVVERDIRRSAARAQEDLVTAPERDAAEPETAAAPRAARSLAPLPGDEAPGTVEKPRPAFPGVRSRRVEPPSLASRDATPAEPPVSARPPVAVLPPIEPPAPPAIELEPVLAPPPPIARTPPRPTAGLDPAGASDMARDLERALSRPGSPVAPSRSSPAPAIAPVPSPTLPPAPPPEPPQLMAPEVLPPPPVSPVVEEVPPPPPLAAPVVRETTSERVSERVLPPAEAEAVREPQPMVLVPPPPPKPPEPAPAKSSARPGGTAFSVEEIEAEFARLLGRPLDRKE